jgi:lipase maturation factor 1
VFDSLDQTRPFAERWFADPAPYLLARRLWLRSLGLIFLSTFYALWFQIHGLIGPNGILPARDYLLYAKQAVGAKAYWLIPSLLWIDAGRGALTALVVTGLIASVLLTLNVLPRTSIAVAAICHLSFVAAAQEFSGYQSDGMLLEAALLSLFLGHKAPPTRAAVFLLQWEWFRIYFQSGLVKILSGEEQWRNLTAMDKYYENGPLPTLFAWYVQQWPHAFHATTAAVTLIAELFLVFLLFAPRPVKLVLFAIATALQVGIILTANYAFLNYLVLALGIFLLEDSRQPPTANRQPNRLQLVALPLIFTLTLIIFFAPHSAPARFIAPFRVVNSYGLFAVMTRARFELEFQGTRDGRTWIVYPFRYKPQNPREAPRFFAPYQPRFDWNLWFASLGSVSSDPWVMSVQERLLANEPDVLRLFRANPFADAPPRAVRVVIWQYWFTTHEERARTGAYWNRRFLGEYAPVQTK